MIQLWWGDFLGLWDWTEDDWLDPYDEDETC